MSKLVREVAEVFDEAFESAEKILPRVLEYMVELSDGHINSEQFEEKVKEQMAKNKTKTYTQYVEDLTHIFEANGWKKS